MMEFLLIKLCSHVWLKIIPIAGDESIPHFKHSSLTNFNVAKRSNTTGIVLFSTADDLVKVVGKVISFIGFGAYGLKPLVLCGRLLPPVFVLMRSESSPIVDGMLVIPNV